MTFNWAENTDSVQDFAQNGGLAAQTTDCWIQYQTIQAELDNIERAISKNAFVSPEADIIGAVRVADKARILPGARIEGPAYIGKNTLIGSFSLIRGGSFVGNKSVIGSYCECVSSVIGPRSGIFHFNVLSHSLVGRDCHMTSFVVTGSTRPDNEPVVPNPDLNGVEKIQQRGCIVKSSTYMAPHVHITPDTMIGKECAIGTFVRVDKDIPPNTHISAELNYSEQKNELNTVGVDDPPRYPFSDKFV